MNTTVIKRKRPVVAPVALKQTIVFIHALDGFNEIPELSTNDIYESVDLIYEEALPGYWYYIYTEYSSFTINENSIKTYEFASKHSGLDVDKYQKDVNPPKYAMKLSDNNYVFSKTPIKIYNPKLHLG